ncbi:MAG: hypothetical protein ACSHYB_05065 [Roseibacillus sp.]
MSDSPRKLPYQQRARSLPHKHFYRVSLCWAVVLYTLVLCIIAAGIGFALVDNVSNGYLLVALVLSALLVWVFSFFSRKKATCPLCKGTPFLDSRASKHVKAVRILPFNYGTTNILRALVTRRFRCHFCGTPFDMLKTNLSTKNDHPPYKEAKDS